MSRKVTARAVVNTSLRIPPELADWLTDRADDLGISRNQFILDLLVKAKEAVEAPKTEQDSR